MIMLTDIPTEQTTAATNIILTILALVGISYLSYIKNSENKKILIWLWSFIFIAFAGLLGAIVHGFEIPESTKYIFWQILYFTLGLVVSLFIIGVMYELMGYINYQILALIIMVGLSFFITAITLDEFIVFIIYEAIALLFSISVYIWLAIKRKRIDLWFIAFGLGISIVAAIIQATGTVKVTFIWEFDHNGIFHLVQAIGLILIIIGLKNRFNKLIK